jgi:hypothetical protein
MTTRRDGRILMFLMANAGLTAANTSAYLTAILPPKGVALVGLLSVVVSAMTGIYVTVTKETGE